jgi:PAS domain S-box-containing protein
VRLQPKLLIVILISVFLQAGVGGVFTIRTFVEQSRETSEKELYASWDRGRMYFEKLKHSSFIHLLSLGQYIGEHWDGARDPGSLEKTIRYLKSDIEVDRIAVVGPSNQLLIDIAAGDAPGFPGIGAILASQSFSHPSSRFFHLDGGPDGGSLHLVTATWLYRRGERQVFVCLVKEIDQDMVRAMAQELGASLALFAGNRPICSDTPAFTLPSPPMPDRVQAVSTPTGPCKLYARIISSDIEGNLRLAVLKSTLAEKVSTGRLVRSLLLAFLITLLVSTLLATSMTAYFVSPFTRLQHWIERYVRDGHLDTLKIHTRDEVGYLAGTFHTLAEKLINEERVIKRQLEEITFLHRYNESILKNLQAGILVADAQGRIEYCNDYLSRLTGVESERVPGLELGDFLSRHFRPAPGAGRRPDRFPEGRLESVPAAGGEPRTFHAKTIPLAVSDRETRLLVVLEDITESERIWEKMAQAEKLASLSLLSAGMAHEINNPLGSILSHVQYLCTVEPEGEKRESLKWIEREAGRIAGIVERLRTFARSNAEEDGWSDLNRAVLDTLELVRREFDTSRISFTTELEADPPVVRLPFGSLEQVILNLLANAVQATGEGGRIRLQTRRRRRLALLEVSDNGCGIPREDRKRVFEPFYTARKGRAGMGLGLSICYSIVTRAGGEIKIHSNGGTTVTVCLPLRKGR